MPGRPGESGSTRSTSRRIQFRLIDALAFFSNPARRAGAAPKPAPRPPPAQPRGPRGPLPGRPLRPEFRAAGPGVDEENPPEANPSSRGQKSHHRATGLGPRSSERRAPSARQPPGAPSRPAKRRARRRSEPGAPSAERHGARGSGRKPPRSSGRGARRPPPRRLLPGGPAPPPPRGQAS